MWTEIDLERAREGEREGVAAGRVSKEKRICEVNREDEEFCGTTHAHTPNTAHGLPRVIRTCNI
jgi:hypothetical protein